MKKITFSIPEISCGHCTSSIESALKELAGINTVSTSIENKSATVEFTAETNEAAIIEAIDNIGFTATVA
ncbi:MAG TPA: heavy-metal-associated domain-containing protein [Candidatus Ignatzschineria merdigallinarum]|uniref:Heavy-metal-associated domain-containing protein n=1 Tax=Candidatus Ignatzschineria merdigallinarum TaxID=2838621 RepID=A0A9D1Q630_9GAMM|nr:heavy-metal-associated domain-containing protein [Candidatus Ignatzschineria merdigallinarum]